MNTGWETLIRQNTRKRNEHGSIEALTQTKRGEKLTGEQHKPEDPSLFSPGYRISNGGQGTPPRQPVIIEND